MRGAPKASDDLAGLLDDGPAATDGANLLASLLGDADLETTRTLEASRLLRRRARRYRNLAALKEETLADFYREVPGPGESFHIVSNGRFDYWLFVPVTIALLGRPLEAFYGSTWTMNRANVLQLFALLDAGKIRAASILTGTYFKRRETAVANTLIEGLSTRGGRYVAFQNHAKVMLLASPPDFITIEGSANFTANPRLETSVVTNDRELYEFHRAWAEEILGGRPA